MKKIITIITLASLMLVGCDKESSSATGIERRQQEELTKQAVLSVGMPDIQNFYEKKTLKKIMEMRDDSKLINYLYTKNIMSGKWIYEGKCIGFGIPYSTQYTNPDKIHSQFHQGGFAVFAQADPNGLYSTPNGTATWVIKIDANNIQTVEYIESEIRVTQTKLPKRLVESWSIEGENY